RQLQQAGAEVRERHLATRGDVRRRRGNRDALDAVLEILQGGDARLDGRAREVFEAGVVRVQPCASSGGRRVLEEHLFEVTVRQGRQLSLLHAGAWLPGGTGGQNERSCGGDPGLCRTRQARKLRSAPGTVQR